MQLKAKADPTRIGFKKKKKKPTTTTNLILCGCPLKSSHFLILIELSNGLKKVHENGISKKTHFLHTHMTDPPIVVSHYFKEDLTLGPSRNH